MDMAIRGCKEIYEIQRKSLIEKYNQLEAEPVAAQEAESL
jgi:hypothetical protein